MKLSIIIPVRNGGRAFAECLAAVRRARAECQSLAETELVVVDDGSTDDSPTLAQAADAQWLVSVQPSSAPHGPSAARNRGARAATGDYLFFVDADVALHANALRLAAEAFRADPRLEACFGSYDDTPAQLNFLSQYKNLLHHYVHQHGLTEASTFWTGCGAIRTTTYHALGGLDEQTYRRPSIEDIDLGYRLRQRGGKIHLLKAMQCTHLKRWTAGSLLRSDIVERGLPWTILLWRESLAQRARPASRHALRLDLNLQTSSRVSVVLAGLLALSVSSLAVTREFWFAPPSCAVVLLVLNRDLYLFFLQRRGFWFTLAAIVWHWFYYLYNSLSFSLGTLQFFLRGAPSVDADGALARPVSKS